MPEVVVASTGAEEAGAADPIVAVKIINVKIKILQPHHQTMSKNLTRRVLVIRMGLQIPVAPAIGPKVAVRPTAATLWSVGGQISLRHALKTIPIEKSASLE